MGEPELHDRIMNELRDILAPVLRYSANPDDFTEFTIHSILALLWKKNPKLAHLNGHYNRLGDPYRLRNADITVLGTFHSEQENVQLTAWNDINAIINVYTPLEFTKAIINQREHTSFATLFLKHWVDAETAYGPHPDKYTIKLNTNGEPSVQSY